MVLLACSLVTDEFVHINISGNKDMDENAEVILILFMSGTLCVGDGKVACDDSSLDGVPGGCKLTSVALTFCYWYKILDFFMYDDAVGICMIAYSRYKYEVAVMTGMKMKIVLSIKKKSSICIFSWQELACYKYATRTKYWIN